MPTLSEREVDAEMATDWEEILARHTADEDGEEGGETQPEPATPAEGETAPEGTEQRTEAPARDEKSGRFQKGARPAKPDKGAPAEPAAAPAEGATDPAQAQQPEAQQGGAKVDLTKPPTTWRPTARAEWAKLPETVRAEIKKREGDYAAGQAQVLPDARFGAEIRGVIDPYRMLIESEGGTPASAVKELLRTAAVLRTGTPQQKYATIAQVARNYGIDLRAFAPRVGPDGRPLAPPQGGTQPPQQQFRDPRVDQLLAHMNTQTQERQAQETQRAEASATQWLNEADAQGNLLRPYATDVLDAMVARIPAIQAANPGISHTDALQRAYEAEVWANPETRSLLQTQQQAADAAKAAAANRQRTEGARRAASVNTRQRGALPQPAQPGTMEETIAETARALNLL